MQDSENMHTLVAAKTASFHRAFKTVYDSLALRRRTRSDNNSKSRTANHKDDHDDGSSSCWNTDQNNCEVTNSKEEFQSSLNIGGSIVDTVTRYSTEEASSLADDSSSFEFSDPPRQQSIMMTFLVGIFVAVGGFLFGYDTGLINSILEMDYVRGHIAPNHYMFSAEQLSVIVSFLSLGTFIGALVAPIISDVYGRKPTIILSTLIIFIIGNSLQVAANGIVLLVVGRVISGIGIGLISAVVPLYQGEAAPKHLRGATIFTYQWAITWGLLVSSAVSQGTHSRDDASSYRIPIGLQYIWSLFLAVGMFFLPESPRYYVLKDQLDKAAKSLSFLRGVPIKDSGLLEELVEIKATHDYEASFGETTILDCFISSKSRPKQTLRMLSGILLQAFQQFSGINFIFYYGVNFLTRAGVENSYRISFITYAVNVAFSVPGLFLVEYLGRRKLLVFGGIIMSISNFIIAIVGVSTLNSVADKVMIAFICLFIASYSATWGGTVWVISAELYPLSVRSKCMAICAASNWLLNFICALITPYLVNTLSHTSQVGPVIFFLWGALNALGVIVAYFTIYETKGLTLEQIDELFYECPNSIQSSNWNRRIRKRRYMERITAVKDAKKDDIIPRAVWESNNMLQTRPVNNIPSDVDEQFGCTNPTNMPQHYMVPQTETTTGLADVEPQNYVDLGNGLGINKIPRGPPSISTDGSGDDGDDDDDDDADNDVAGDELVEAYGQDLSDYNSTYSSTNKWNSTGDDSSGATCYYNNTIHNETLQVSVFIAQLAKHSSSDKVVQTSSRELGPGEEDDNR